MGLSAFFFVKETYWCEWGENGNFCIDSETFYLGFRTHWWNDMKFRTLQLFALILRNMFSHLSCRKYVLHGVGKTLNTYVKLLPWTERRDKYCSFTHYCKCNVCTFTSKSIKGTPTQSSLHPHAKNTTVSTLKYITNKHANTEYKQPVQNIYQTHNLHTHTHPHKAQTPAHIPAYKPDLYFLFSKTLKRILWTE